MIIHNYFWVILIESNYLKNCCPINYTIILKYDYSHSINHSKRIE